METKTRDRARVHLSDVVQLSAYRMMLLNGGNRRLNGLAVKSRGYVRIVHGRHTIWRRVDLLSEREIIGLRHRYKGVTGGQSTPRGAKHPRLCRTCGHANRCAVRPAGKPVRTRPRSKAQSYAMGR